MGPEGAANIIFRNEIKSSENPEETRKKLIEEYRQKFANPYVAAAYGYIDAVIEPTETRDFLTHSLGIAANKGEAPPAKKHGSRRSKRVTESQSHKVTRSQGHKVTESQSHKVTKSQGHKVTKSQSHKVTESQSHRVTKSQSHRVTESQSHRVTESQSHKVTKSQGHKVNYELRITNYDEC